MTERPEIWTIHAGVVPYEEATGLQQEIAAARRAGELPDVLLLLQHPPVLTRGRRSDPAELGMGEDWYRMQGIEVADADRGGRVTYHGPGQLVAYPIVDLAGLGTAGAPDVRAYVEALERAMISLLAAEGVPAQVFGGLTGVWTAGRPPIPVGAPGPEGTTVEARDPELAAIDREARKIGSIGIHVSRGVTTHGLALNVDNDLQPFEWIVPCGMEAARMTSVARELGATVDVARMESDLGRTLTAQLGREPVDVSRERLPRPRSTTVPPAGQAR